MRLGSAQGRCKRCGNKRLITKNNLCEDCEYVVSPISKVDNINKKLSEVVYSKIRCKFKKKY